MALSVNSSRKKTDFKSIAPDDIIKIQHLLNNRPRKSLGFLTPNEVIKLHLLLL